MPRLTQPDIAIRPYPGGPVPNLDDYLDGLEQLGVRAAVDAPPPAPAPVPQPVPVPESPPPATGGSGTYASRFKDTDDPRRDLVNYRASVLADATAEYIGRNSAARWPEVMARWLTEASVTVPDGEQEVVRTALSLPGATEAITTLATERIRNAWDSVPNSLAGLTTVVNLADFHAVKAIVADGAGRMELLPKGGTASDLYFGITTESIKLARYAARLSFAEEDLIDQAESVNLQLMAADEMGRSARRLVQDLVWSLLLSNPTMTDGTAVFAAGRSNYGSGGGSALQQSSLVTALTQIHSVTVNDAEGRAVHLNLPARYLVVNPALIDTARRLVKLIQLDDGQDLVVRAESRMGATATIDPTTGTAYTGSATKWMLAAPADISPSILVGAMGGRLEPRIRSGQLSQGEWGVWIDCNLDVGAAIADYRPLYWSEGA